MAGSSLRVASGFPSFRLFIFGVDVTDDVASYSVALDDGRQPSTLTFTLADIESRYTITPKDMELLFPRFKLEDIKDPIVELAQYAAIDPSNGNSPTSTFIDLAGRATQEYTIGRARAGIVSGISDPMKAAVLAAKVGVTIGSTDLAGVPVGGDATRSGDTAGASFEITDVPALRGKPLRYGWAPKKCIFHANDPVRLFERDAWTGEWFYGFSGFGSTFSRSVSANGMRTWTITCEDPLAILRRARIAFNPGFLDGASVIQSDAALRSFHADGVVGKSLPEYVMTMVFGPDMVSGAKSAATAQFGAAAPPVSTRVGVNGASQERISETVVGSFNFDDSRVFLLGPAPSTGEEAWVNWLEPVSRKVLIGANASLPLWQDAIDWRVRVEDLHQLIVPERTADIGAHEQSVYSSTLGADGTLVRSVDAERLINLIGTAPEMFPVDRGRVMMLLPRALGANGADVLLRDVIAGPAAQTPWKTRLGLMYDVVQRLDMCLYATPKGDVIIEMPLYDYNPEDFEKTDGTPTATSGTVLSDTSAIMQEFGVSQVTDTSLVRLSFTDRYRIKVEDTVSVVDTENAEQIKTVVRCTRNIIQNSQAGGTTESFEASALAYAAHLIPLYGVRFEEVPPRVYVTTHEGAELNAHLMLNKMNADAESLRVGVIPMLGIGPNRPIYFEEGPYIGTLRNVSRSYTWGVSGSAQMDLNVNYVRRWHGHVSAEGDMIFSTIGGFGGRPLNWALLFQAPSAKAAESAPAPLETPAVVKSEAAASVANDRAISTEKDDARVKAAKVTRYAETVLLPWLKLQGIDTYITSTFRTLDEDLALQRQGRVRADWDLAKHPSHHQLGMAVDFGARRATVASISAALVNFQLTTAQGRIHNVEAEGDHVHVNFTDPNGWPKT